MDTFYNDWINACVARAQMEILRPFRVALGAYSSLLKGDCLYYPFKGIVIFFEDWENILPIYISAFFPTLLLQTILELFSFLYLFPVNFLLMCCTAGPMGFLLALTTTRSEASKAAQTITNCVLPPDAILPPKMNSLFDHILCLTGNERVVIPGKLQRVVPPSPTAEVFNISGWVSSIYAMLTATFIKMLPILGPVISTYNNLLADIHSRSSRLYRLQRLRRRQAEYYHLKQKEGQLLMLGVCIYVLESIPVIGTLFFRFTNQIGIAYMQGLELQSKKQGMIELLPVEGNPAQDHLTQNTENDLQKKKS